MIRSTLSASRVPTTARGETPCAPGPLRRPPVRAATAIAVSPAPPHPRGLPPASASLAPAGRAEGRRPAHQPQVCGDSDAGPSTAVYVMPLLAAPRKAHSAAEVLPRVQTHGHHGNMAPLLRPVRKTRRPSSPTRARGPEAHARSTLSWPRLSSSPPHSPSQPRPAAAHSRGLQAAPKDTHGAFCTSS